MDLEARIQYLETINNNQENTIKKLNEAILIWDRHSRKLQTRLDKHHKFLDDLVDECEGSLLHYQYKWVTNRIAGFLSELHDE